MPVAPPARGVRGPANLTSGDPLRDNLFKLFGRSFVRAEKGKAGSGRVVYRDAARIAVELCGQPWAQATIFPDRVLLARRFLKETGLGAGSEADFIRHVLMANFWASAWTGIFLGLDAREFSVYCVAKGVEHLRHALQRKRGVILLHSHTVFTQLFWRWLEHQHIEPGITLWQWTWSRERSEKDDPKLRAIESAKEMHAATRLLKDGGIVHSLADGRWGTDRYSMEFHGRQRVFQSSFAELALLTGARVLPVDVILRPDGRVRIEIGEHFVSDNSGKDRNGNVELLVHEYVRHLAGRWRRHGSNLEWFQINRHLSLPPIKNQEA